MYVGVPTNALRARLRDLERREWDIRECQTWGLTVTVDPRQRVDVGKSVVKYRPFERCMLIDQRNHIERSIRVAINSVNVDLKECGEEFAIRKLKVFYELTKSGMVHAHGVFVTRPRKGGFKKHSVSVQMFHRALEVYCGRTLIEWLPGETDWEEYCTKDYEVNRGLAWAMPSVFTHENIDDIIKPFKANTDKCIRKTKKLTEMMKIVQELSSDDD